jgi:rhamnulokinase
VTAATFAAVDLGAQSGRVAVGSFDGEHLEVEEVHRFPNTPVRAGGRLQWDVLALFRGVVDGLRVAGRRGDVDSVAVDSWAVDFGLVDRAGGLLRNPVHYRDARRAAVVEAVFERVPAREIYGRTGIQLLPINTIFELAAMVADGDPALDAADRLLLIPDLMHHWLCGSEVTEHTNATTTQCLDPRSDTWLVDVLERLGIPIRELPEVVKPGTKLGTLTDDVAAETWLGDVPVVAVGTHDTASAVAGTPLRDDRCAYASVGTWSLVGVEATEAIVNDSSFFANVTNEGGVEGTVRVMRNVTGLWLLHECARVWSQSGRSRSIEELLALAEGAEPLRSLIDPNDAVFVEPGDMPARIADYCARTGQPTPADQGAVVRCILESLALKHAEAVAALAELTGRDLDQVHVVGGGANNELLCRWTAEASGRVVLAGPAEATLVGNLLVQAIAAGEIASLAEGREVVRRSFDPAVHEPREQSAWLEARERFATLAGSQRPLEVEV